MAMSQLFSLEQLHLILKSVGAVKEFCVAYSGGVDSHVLLHALVQLRNQSLISSVKAIHVHHGYSAQADEWAKHCQKICQDLQVPFVLKKIQVKPKAKESWEAIARTLRYQALGEELTDASCLVTGHTQTDQAETVLLQLLRGTGAKGLAAMPVQTLLGKHPFLRPLLNLSREQILAYAEAQNLIWIEDDSNLNERFTRNYLRHRVFPLLKQRWQSFESVLARSALHFAETDQLLSTLAQQDLAQVSGQTKDTLAVSKLLQLDQARQRNVIRYWLHRQGFQLPEHRKLLQLQKDLLHARQDAKPKIVWGQVEVLRFQDEIYAFNKAEKIDANWQIEWDLKKDLILPGQRGILRVEYREREGLCLPEGGSLIVRFRRGGEKIRLPNRTGHHSLKKLFQEWNVPTWQRDKIPLLWLADELVGIVGYAMSADFVVQGKDVGAVVYLDYEN